MLGARTSFAAIAGLAMIAAAIHAGCRSDNEFTPDTTVTTVVVTGAGAGTPCNFGGPDGYCVPSGPAAEGCDCPDCASAALCTGGCNDDGVCRNDPDSGGTEDCSCDDCFYKVPSCAPNVDPNACDEQPGCGATEACTCPDCTDLPFCRDNCVDNGVCVPAFEGCSCADCAALCSSGSGSTTTGGGGGGSTTSTGGAGGSGGTGGAGGA
jgi:uncharacterized membrane protein YgcG